MLSLSKKILSEYYVLIIKMAQDMWLFIWAKLSMNFYVMWKTS